jgi:hypothetical protein
MCLPVIPNIFTSAIVRTLNATYHVHSYGIGNMHTTYPVSAFITDLIYLKGSEIDIDVKHITVSDVYSQWAPNLPLIEQSLGVRCTEIEGTGHATTFNAENVGKAIRSIVGAGSRDT